jgi:Zn-dependent protease/CBS domain-containing protein
MPRSQIKLGKPFGVPIRLDLSWLLIFFLVTWNLGVGYFPSGFPAWPAWLIWLASVLTSLSFFASVLLHELGHALMARRIGVPVHDITLYLFGGAAQIAEEPKSARGELLLGAVGPLVSIALAGLFYALHLAVRGVSAPVGAYGMLLAGMNLSLGLFNLIPGFPLDGGRVLRAALWAWRRDLTVATRWASRAGQLVAYGFVAYGALRAFAGAWQSGLWIIFVGLFLEGAARSSFAQLNLRNLLEGHSAGELMSRECSYLPPQLTLDVLVNQYLLASGKRCFVVGRPDEVKGLLTPHNVRRVPESNWPTTHIADITTPLAEVHTVRADTPLWDVLQEMTTDGVNQLPVLDEAGKVVGMISRDQLITFLSQRSALGV